MRTPPPPDRAAGIDALPDALLGRVLALTRGGQGSGLPLVCRRWRAAFYSEPALWGSIRLTPDSLAGLSPQSMQQWFATRHIVLQRVSRLLCKLEVVNGGVIDQAAAAAAAAALAAQGGVGGSASWQLADLLQALRHSLLTEVVLHYTPAPPPPVLQALLRFQRLSALQLHGHKLPLEAPAAVLCRLPRLRDFSCSAGELSDAHIDALTQVSQLTRLALVTTEHPLPASVTHLTRLSRLRSLALHEHAIHQGTLQLPAPADFGGGGTAVGGVSLHTYDFNPGGWLRVAGAEMKACKYSPRAGSGATPVLWLYSLRRMASLQAFLDAALPPDTPLLGLSMYISNVEAAALQGCARLAGLTFLQLGSCSCAWSATSLEACQALLTQAPLLEELSVGKFQLAAPPPCLRAHTRLHKLCLAQNVLTGLPLAPYLAGLEELDLSNNVLTHLPPALAAATSLRRLSLRCNFGLTLTVADVDSVLRHLASLRQLDVSPSQATPEVMAHLRRCLPLLKAG